MEDLGSDFKTVNDGLLFRTICHNEEGTGKYKLHYHSNTKTFYCYTNCGNLSNIFNLVMHIKDWKFGKAYKYICNFLNIPLVNEEFRYGFKEISDNSFIKKFNSINDREDEVFEKLQPIDKNILKNFYDIYYQGWINEYISIEAMKDFNIKFDILNGCIIIPHYDIANELVGIRGRYLSKRMIEDGKKYMPIVIGDDVYSYPIGLNLFGLNVNANNIFKYKKVIVGESEKFVIQHRTFYGKESIAVALMGSTISKEQILLLKYLGVETIILALDKEYENKEEEELYSLKIRNSIINKLYPYFTIEIIWDKPGNGLLNLKDSPTDRGKEVFENLYRNRITFSN